MALNGCRLVDDLRIQLDSRTVVGGEIGCWMKLQDTEKTCKINPKQIKKSANDIYFHFVKPKNYLDKI